MPVRICSSYCYCLIPTGRLEGDSDEDQCSAGKKFETHGHRIASSPASSKKGFKALVFCVDRSSHRALGVACEGADSGSSATWSGSRSSASPVESISCRTDLEFLEAKP